MPTNTNETARLADSHVLAARRDLCLTFDALRREMASNCQDFELLSMHPGFFRRRPFRLSVSGFPFALPSVSGSAHWARVAGGATAVRLRSGGGSAYGGACGGSSAAAGAGVSGAVIGARRPKYFFKVAAPSLFVESK